MASQLLVDYFFLHLYFLLDGVYSSTFGGTTERLAYKGDGDVMLQGIQVDVGARQHKADPGRMFKWILPEPLDGPLLIKILRESLLRAIHDIDVTFSKEASKRSLLSGSTATIVLIVEGQILVANVGDSKAIMCSKTPLDFKGKHSKFRRKRNHKDVQTFKKDAVIVNPSVSIGHYLCAKELTKDHHPDRDEERKRVEAAGGFVKVWAGVPRVNGELAVSRAIGDIPYKRYGVISVPEVTDWLPLYDNDSYLIVASDGIFEKLTAQEVCDLLWDIDIQMDRDSNLISFITNALADLVVNTAFERGSMDNMAAIVIPLAPSRDLSVKDGCEACDNSEGCLQEMYAVPNVKIMKSDSDTIDSGLISMDYFNQIEMKFNRLLVNARHRQVGCFYLAEDLNEDMDYIFLKDHIKDEVHDGVQALPGDLQYHDSEWSLDLYTGQLFCWNFDVGIDKDKGQCVNPEGFVKFLSLLNSFPLNDSGLNSSESFNYTNPDFRYVLKRKFDRGSYGEVWLAFQWNCSEESSDLIHFPSKLTNSHTNTDEQQPRRQPNSYDKNNFASGESKYFILKRIMVERGNMAYLSGLREKYFGELFLNASLFLDTNEAQGFSKTSSTGGQYDASCLTGLNKLVPHGIGNSSNPRPAHMISQSFRFASAINEEGLNHIARFVESFESQSKEIWLVFQNEGLSLSKLIYTVEDKTFSSRNQGKRETSNVQVLYPSAWWHWLRTTEAGQREMQNLMWQLLLALKSCHERNITHRDIKPENMIICFKDVDSGECLREIPSREKQYNIVMRIIDFGSAIDEFTSKYLYGSGPSRSEQTFEYMSPEALLNVSWFQGPTSTRLKYDMWSVGVVFMELILGSPHVFQISDRTRVLLDQHLEGWGDNMKELAYKLRSLMEMCILIPGVSPRHRSGVKDHGEFSPASWKCTEEFFAKQVKNRDPLKLGFPNVWALRFVRQLLVWHPEDRMSVDEALQHPYFQLEM